MRSELSEAIGRAWQALGACGVWWTGEERLRIAREARGARGCALCQARKAAPIPHAVGGDHRIVSDPGRLSETWFKRTIAAGLSEEAYVGLLGVVAVTTAVDTFYRALGAPLSSLGSGATP
jgi:hypothetical protein